MKKKYKDDDGKINYNFIDSFINHTNTYKFSTETYDYYINTEDIYFVKNYIYKHGFIKKLLDNPNIIFDLKTDNVLTGIDKEVITIFYVVSLLHNKVYDISIIECLFHTISTMNFAEIRNNKLFYRCYESDIDDGMLNYGSLFYRERNETFLNYIDLEII